MKYLEILEHAWLFTLPVKSNAVSGNDALIVNDILRIILKTRGIINSKGGQNG
jgi:hypothetical protein